MNGIRLVNFSSLDLNLLRVLDALLRDGSTIAAGRRLGLSQPAVSAALGRLRHALSDDLFQRRGQGLEPTDYARALETPLRQALETLEAALSGPKGFDPGQADIAFRLSGTDFFAEMLLPPLADRLSRQAPGVKVQLVDLVPESYIRTLDRYEVDLALIPSGDFPDWVCHRPVFWSDFSTVARKGHPRLAGAGLSGGDTIPMDLFCDLGHVLFSPEGKLRTMGDAALARLGRERRVVMTLPVFSGVWRAVAGSDLIGLIPTQLARQVAGAAGLEIYVPPMPIPPVLLEMAWHRRSDANPAQRWLRGIIADLLGPLNDGFPDLPA